MVRLLSKLASTDELPGADGAQRGSVHEVLDGASTGTTPQFAVEVELGKKSIASAFILAAGEGTRLRPLTDKIPKPLIPVFHKPLLTFALDHFLALGITKIGINTRYLYEKFYQEFSVTSERLSTNGENTYEALGSYQGHPIHLFREPIHIDSAGALRNARAFLQEGPCLLHNGDILTTIPLAPLIEHHHKSRSIATLLLREEGGLKNVCFDEATNTILDIRGRTKNKGKGALFFYPGIAVLEPALLDWISPKEGPACLIDALLAAMQGGCKVAGLVSREGFATDLGTPEAYLQAHRDILEQDWKFPYELRTKMKFTDMEGIKTSERFPEFAGASLDPIYEGGSDRQFFRCKNPQGNSLILIHYNPEKAENKDYAAHALFLKKQGLHVPEVLGHSTEEHLLWLQDLGERNLWSERKASWKIRKPLYEATLIQVAKLHRIPLKMAWEADLTLQPAFNEKLYHWEQEYFIENALGGLWNIDAKKRNTIAISDSLSRLRSSLAALPRQLIHRDLQSQNVILFENQPWLIDFQGMRAGLAQYDLASLLCDPYVEITPVEREELLSFYEKEMSCYGVALASNFRKIFCQCAAQRLMQALGAYGFLALHRGKSQFLKHVTPALHNLREILKNLDPEDRLEELEEILSSTLKAHAACIRN